MAVLLSIGAQNLIKEIGIQPQIILDIEGMDLIFGARPVLKVLNWDDDNAYWDNNLYWDGNIENENSRDYISLDGTTTSITQQIAPDNAALVRQAVDAAQSLGRPLATARDIRQQFGAA